jgi:hypothetical protein
VDVSASRGRRTLAERQGRHLSPDCHPVIDASAPEQRETIMIFAASWAISTRLHNLFRRFVREGANDLYGEHLAAAERMYRRYTLTQLQLLLEFVREGRLLNEREAARLEERNRGR